MNAYFEIIFEKSEEKEAKGIYDEFELASS